MPQSSSKSPGLDQALAAARGRALLVTRLTDRRSPAALHAWHRAPVFEGLYHLAVLAHAHLGAAARLDAVEWSGDDRPSWIRVRCAGADGASVQVVWTLTAAVDALIVAAPGVHWRRDGRHPTLTIDGAPRPVARDGGELERMLRGFHRAVRDRGPAPVAAADGAAVMGLTVAAVDALAAAGAPLARATAPRHVASPALAPRYR